MERGPSTAIDLFRVYPCTALGSMVATPRWGGDMNFSFVVLYECCCNRQGRSCTAPDRGRCDSDCWRDGGGS